MGFSLGRARRDCGRCKHSRCRGRQVEDEVRSGLRGRLGDAVRGVCHDLRCLSAWALGASARPEEDPVKLGETLRIMPGGHCFGGPSCAGGARPRGNISGWTKTAPAGGREVEDPLRGHVEALPMDMPMRWTLVHQGCVVRTACGRCLGASFLFFHLF